MNQPKYNTGLKFLMYGIAYGFSDDAIIHFVRFRVDPTYDVPLWSASPLMRGTGYAPAPSELSLTAEEIINGITQRRVVNIPFPDSSGKDFKIKDIYKLPEFKERFKKLIEILGPYIKNKYL